jgi:hypothetical protein
MAVPYKVKNFHIMEMKDPNGIKRVHLDAHLTDAKGRDVSKDYLLSGDTRATNAGIVEQVTEGFNYAIENYAKVKISVDTPRNYVWFYLPSSDGVKLCQYTGKENKL